jgi:DNA phosphorothioation-associated putative methyltransferase
VIIGKKIFDDLYIHQSAIDELNDEHLIRVLSDALNNLNDEAFVNFNVVKINLKSKKISLLEYENFETDPFPSLITSYTLGNTINELQKRSYQKSLNPPILHRKELLVSKKHPMRNEWESLTRVAESLGFFEQQSSIGFKLNWEKTIYRNGFKLIGNEFLPIGNSEEVNFDIDNNNSIGIERHLTAIARTNLSAPVQLLLRNGLINQNDSFFDYGCGRGSDIQVLRGNGIAAAGWDPYFAKENAKSFAKVVNLGFVVNVIEDPAERVEAIQGAFALCEGVMSVGVMLYSGDSPGRPYSDGFLTSRNTFQKYFSQTEFKDYLEQVLHHEVFLVGPGVAFVFKDKNLEQRFCVERYRTKRVASRLLSTQMLRLERQGLQREKLLKKSKSEKLFEIARPCLDTLWERALDLGRFPEADEIDNLTEVIEQLESINSAKKVLQQHYDQSLLIEAGNLRTEDLKLFFAMQHFGKKAPYKSLEQRLQRDIKTFFGDYRTAQLSGMQLLRDAADSEKIKSACSYSAENGLGYLEEGRALQLHIDLTDRLPIILRAYISCGLVLYESITEFQLVKIHAESGKLTFLKYEGFETSPLPLLSKRIKINIRLQDYDVFDYEEPTFPKPYLFFKSRYLSEEQEAFAEQQSFDEQLANVGLDLNRPKQMSRTEFHSALNLRRLEIYGYKIQYIQTIPDLDEKCGVNFRFRDFIECGETQQRLSISNLPRSPNTYNALFQLATQILDPITDYFGAIKLTYGFCSGELGKHIKERVEPSLDQHASHEKKKNGKFICERLGAACDFIVEDEDMREVADWIIENLPFDRLYFYGSARPLHVSFGPSNQRSAFEIQKLEGNKIIPKSYKLKADTV